ncbi:MAG TPA: CoA transferase [Pseudolabrys sp.]|nr:CoA transferase [Pseudolabrys sp.]
METTQSSPTHKSKAAPLAGVRVLSLGGIWAGRVASMLLADQGAEVIEINRPNAERNLSHALLSRGKCEIALDLNSSEGRQQAIKLALGADIVIENLGARRSARFGLDHSSLKTRNPKLVYVSIPGFATGSSHQDIPAWEGAVAASLGVYTDIHALGPTLGGAPTFTALPMASAYGGVHASIAASTAFLNRLATGLGTFIEVPLADALLSAMALLIMKIEDQPRCFDLPPMDKAMSDIAMPILRDLNQSLTSEHRAAIRSYITKFAQPLFTNHVCADGRFVFINAIGHVHQPRACLETLGILDDLIAEGMVVASPYEVGGDGNNISDAGGLSPHWKSRLRLLMSERFLTRPAADWERLLQQAGVPVAVVRTADEWLSWSATETGGNVAKLADPEFGSTRQAGRFISIEGVGLASPGPRPRQSQSPGAEWQTRFAAPELTLQKGGKKFLDGIRVLDFSNVIAGPVAARVFAEYGADVVRIDPVFPQAGPRMTMWFGVDVNQGKRSIILDLKTGRGRGVAERLVREADVVIHNYLDRSLEGIGISEAQLRAIKPDIITCQISAWGGAAGGPLKDFPAYDPVLQAATGITARYGSPEAPVIHGLASCVDYITGFSAALGAIHALVAKRLGRGGSSVRTSLAMGAQLVQFPFMVRGDNGDGVEEPSGQQAFGYGPYYRLYQARDGWIFLACRKQDLAQVANALGSSADGLSTAVAQFDSFEIERRIRGIGSASTVPVMRLDRLRDRISVAEEREPSFPPRDGGMLMIEAAHPSGHRISLPFPSWYRSDRHSPTRLSPAPKAGTHTVELLSELSLGEAEIATMIEQNIAAKGWTISKGYFPEP